MPLPLRKSVQTLHMLQPAGFGLLTVVSHLRADERMVVGLDPANGNLPQQVVGAGGDFGVGVVGRRVEQIECFGADLAKFGSGSPAGRVVRASQIAE